MKNDRREFLKLTGLFGAASLLPFQQVFASTRVKKAASCTLIPTETAGPFPLDLTENTTFFRKNITETKTGVPLKLKLKIIGDNNCGPMQNVRVNIWHCDKDGLYSGYSQTNNQGQAGLTYLRGYQFTDVNGEVEFETIFPGWYTGRICHIHFQVYVSSSYSAISQLTFPITEKQALYSANSTFYTKGTDPLALTADNIFSDGYQFQLASLTQNSTTGGYESYLEVTVQGTGTVGMGHIEKENAKNFTLGQNFPNPFTTETTIPFKLVLPSSITLDLYDLQGRKVATLQRKNLNSGDHELNLNMHELNLPHANYVFQLKVENANGTYVDSKLMTAFK
ncbi:MAG: T9SS type A sorting domain-containing protein [Bacteroidia bacterium]|jgi:protocatechuate 3,4-dioxygenase beta subunit|nr:T9SS type A sorting domain-containing protein [Bacteroidia bacterium]